ncbi:MAG: aspartyl protease family protein [Woeseiaceae bacterium]|nr:aspartyl protease family protein [Woeseiaceae bacterium]
MRTRLILCLAMLWCTTSSAGVSEWIAIEIRDGQLLMPLTIGGQPATALIDTGAMGHAISESFLAEHGVSHAKGKAVEISGVVESRRAVLVNSVDVELFGTQLQLDQLIPMRVGGIDFVLGLPFFELFVVQIDYPGRRMRVINRESVDMKKFANVKMRRAGGSATPQVRVDLNGESKAWLKLDTGNSGPIFITRTKAERLGWLEQFPAQQSLASGINDVAFTIETFSLPTMTIGPFELEDVRVAVPGHGQDTNIIHNDPVEWSTGTNIKRGKKTDGLLGYDILQHFIVTIDVKRSLLNLDLPR